MSASQSPLTYEGILEMFRQNAEEFRQQAEERKEIDRQYAEERKEIDRKFDQMSAETDRRIREVSAQMKATDERLDKKFQATSKEIASLGSRVGNIVEAMVGGDIVEQFQALGYAVTEYCRNKIFGPRGTEESGEIDLLLENGEIAILIEVKTTLKSDDVTDFIEKLEKYRRYLDAKDDGVQRCLIGAVAAAVADDHVVKFAQRKGMYVIVQSGRTVEILPPPEGFVAKQW